jgi:YHS domain-containing protein
MKNMDEKDTPPVLKFLSAKTVCGREMTVDPAWYPKAQYRGNLIYFCTEFCLDAFLADPDRFFAAHQRVKIDQ